MAYQTLQKALERSIPNFQNSKHMGADDKNDIRFAVAPGTLLW